MVWLPAVRAEVLKLAIPPESVPVPIGLPPSRNITVPVGVPEPGATAVTVAVRVTASPKTEGLTDEVTVVVLAARPVAHAENCEVSLVLWSVAVAVMACPAGVAVTVALNAAFPEPLVVAVTEPTNVSPWPKPPGAQDELSKNSIRKFRL